MRKLTTKLTKLVVGIVVAAVLIGVAVYVFFAGGSNRTVTAQFSSAVGIYVGTPVDILGVPVGKVTKVTPHGAMVDVEMQYSGSDKLKSNAISEIVANSIVSDRYVQLAPLAKPGEQTLPSGATIPLARTASPAELDDIYSALDKLSLALGPHGANKTGALSELLKVSAANLKGNGAALGNTVTQLSKAAKTLADGRTDLFATVKNLEAFSQALAASDGQVRHFEQQLAAVSSELASERADLGSALHDLSITLDQVASFVRSNAGKLHTDLGGLALISKILVKENSSLNETLAVAPVALANIVHAYQPDPGVIATRSNISSLTDPGQICELMKVGGLLDPVKKLLGPATGAIVKTCTAIIKKLPGGGSLPGVDTGALEKEIQSLLSPVTGGNTPPVGGLIGVGG